ncbi:MAG: MerC domain-containing protein, partial [Bacteroidota bacterium]
PLLSSLFYNKTYIMWITPIKLDRKSDSLGILASSLCMIHCLATPLIFVVQACTASCCEAGPWWWRMIDYVFLVVSIAAIYHSAKTTTLRWMPMAMYICWGALAVVILNEGMQFLPIPHLFIYVPAFSLVFLHLYNRKYCQCEMEDCCVAEQTV